MIVGHASNKSNRYGSINFNSNHLVTEFHEKKNGSKKFINSGIYFFSKASLMMVSFNKKNISLEEDIIPILIANKELLIFKCNECKNFIDIGVPEALLKARKYLDTWRKKPAIFWDRDNTLNVDEGYTHKVEDLFWKKGALEALKCSSEKGFYNFIVTNQSGVARGYYGQREVMNFHRQMQTEIIAAGSNIEYFSHCPHHIDGLEGSIYSIECDCRKPKPGMIDNICNLFPVDMESSYLVGDSDVDRLLARHFGLKFIQIDNDDNVKNKLLLNFRDISNDYN